MTELLKRRWRDRCIWADLRDQRLARERRQADAMDIARDLQSSKSKSKSKPFGRRRTDPKVKP